MFKKPVKIKSNNQVKGSERKTIKDLFLKNFTCSECDFDNVFNKKEALNCIKLQTHENVTVLVYMVQKRPMFFTVHDKVYPTVFLLWKLPELLQTFTTHSQVMNFISSGADLMLPGVVTPPTHTGLAKYGTVSENDVVSVNLSTNKAAIAVGLAAQSSSEMSRSNGKGKCVLIHHFYGDKLCTLEGLSNLPIPNLGIPEWLSLKSYEDDFPQLGAENPSKVISTCSDSEISEKIEEELIETDPIEAMDGILWYCFLGALKYSKEITLPVLTSNFFKLHMLPMCPSDKTLDIKKTSYKKLKPFLENACKTGLITVNEIKKGVEAITDINKTHPEYNKFYLNPEERPKKAETEQHATNVAESFIITQNVLPIFKTEGYNKGDVIDRQNIRKIVTNYVKSNNFQMENDHKLVQTTGDVLGAICKTNNPITWEELMENVCAAMKNCYKVKSGVEEIFSKGKISPITMSVSVRSGNKKVTLVDNLGAFGINLGEFAKECQHGVAASTSLVEKPGKNGEQLLVQGNQVVFINKLLTEKYKIPKKYIRGLENAPKKKK